MRLSHIRWLFLLSLTSAAYLLPLSSAFACVRAPPLRQETGESDEAFEARRLAEQAETLKTPEQRELEKQADLWDNSDVVFIGHIDAVRIKGTVYPRPNTQAASTGKREPVPLPPFEPAPLMFLDGGQAKIRPIRILKGNMDFPTSWHWVGGMTSCGDVVGGDLGYTFPADELIIFASWQDVYQYSNGKEVKSKRLELYGVKFEAVIEPRILSFLKGRNPIEPG